MHDNSTSILLVTTELVTERKTNMLHHPGGLPSARKNTDIVTAKHGIVTFWNKVGGSHTWLVTLQAENQKKTKLNSKHNFFKLLELYSLFSLFHQGDQCCRWSPKGSCRISE